MDYKHGLATQPVRGVVAGAAAGVATAFGASTLMPGIALPILIAMGAFLGAFHGGLLGLLSHRHKSPARATVSVMDPSYRR